MLSGRGTLAGTAIVAGWTVNELDGPARARLLEAVMGALTRGAAFLMIEPLARGAAPWWKTWVQALTPHHVVAGDYKFAVELPARLADLADAAGFARRALGARVLWVG
jgi:hypothetical protein